MCFIRQALDRVAAVPGVESVSGINHLPLAGDLWTFSFAIEGRPAPPPSQEPSAAFRVVFPGYFHTMRIPLLRGRDFTAHDDANAPGVVIVNETMARHYWPGEDAIGKRIRLGFDGAVVHGSGIVKDVEQSDWGATRGNEFYFSALPESGRYSAVHDAGRADRRRPRGAGAARSRAPCHRSIATCRCPTCSRCNRSWTGRSGSRAFRRPCSPDSPGSRSRWRRSESTE